MAITRLLGDRFKNYNKIVNLRFYGSEGFGSAPLFTIACPAKGRKPNIEINGSMYADTLANNITITIRNLYYDRLTGASGTFTKLQIEAGYEGNTKIALEGDIYYMVTTSPGPESETVIMLVNAKITDWLNTMVNVSFEPNFTLLDAVTTVSQSLGKTVIYSADMMTSPSQFTFQGAAKDALNTLEKMFSGSRIYVREDSVVVTSETDTVEARKITIPFLSSPLQLTGGGEGAVQGTFTSPWNPELRPGDDVVVNSGYYNTTTNVNNRTKTVTIKVYSIDFSFGTVTNSNKMTVSGDISRSVQGGA